LLPEIQWIFSGDYRQFVIKLSKAKPFVEEYTDRHHITGMGDSKGISPKLIIWNAIEDTAQAILLSRSYYKCFIGNRILMIHVLSGHFYFECDNRPSAFIPPLH